MTIARLGNGGRLILLLAALVAFHISARRASTQTPDMARQVTLFGIVATPNSSTVDKRLVKIAPQLRKLLPNHGFKLLDVQSKRLEPGEVLSSNLGDGFSAETTLVQPIDPNGKVQLRCVLTLNGMSQIDTVVATPPNQLFFCDKPLANGSRMLIGIGAR